MWMGMVVEHGHHMQQIRLHINATQLIHLAYQYQSYKHHIDEGGLKYVSRENGLRTIRF